MREVEVLTSASPQLDGAAPTDPRTDNFAGGNVARGLFAAAWVVMLGLFLSHSIVLSSDSVNNHVHVWYIARDLWHHGRLPWRFPQLAHGTAYAYPYGFVNWTTAALVWPLFGNWAVTLWTAVGAVGCIVATFVAFPEVRRGWWAAAVLANPAIFEALLFGQQSFAWASMFVVFGIAAWRRHHPLAAALLVGVGQATHPAIVAPTMIVFLAFVLPFARDRWIIVRWYALSCLIALPAVWLVFASPTSSTTSPGAKAVDFVATLGPRVLIVMLPFFYALMRRVGWRWLGPCALVASLGLAIGPGFPLNVAAQFRALVHRHTDTSTLDAYLRSPNFVPGATYRVLRGNDAKLGLSHVLRAGGRLDSEMFPESMAIKNFKSAHDYERLLCDRVVDQVLAFDSYTRSRHTNELALLAQIAAAAGPLRLHVAASGADWRVYTVDRNGCAQVGANALVTGVPAPFRDPARVP